MKNTDNSLLHKLTHTEISDIAKRIIYLRSTILHMTQLQFATAVNISQTYLSLLENNKKDINMSTILQISSSLRVNLDWLIYGIGDDNNIFQAENITKDYLLQISRAAALHELQTSYALKSNEVEFISWYLNLSSKERQCYASALKTIAELYH